MAYIQRGKISGYIIDVAALIFNRSDGQMFVLNNGTSGSVSESRENVTISNGWITSPQAIIDTTKTKTIQYQTNLTDMMMIAGMLNSSVTIADSSVWMPEIYEVLAVSGEATMGQFTIAHEITDIYIQGMTRDTVGAAPTTGKYLATIGTGSTVVKVLLADIPLGEEVTVAYEFTEEDAYVVTETNGTHSATGTLTRVLPIYSEDDEASDIIGYLNNDVGRVKVTTTPGFDNSYKSESSHTVEFTVIAPKAVNATANKYTLVQV